jgi:hypothetical protein
MSKGRSLTASLVAAALALTLGGCGGDGNVTQSCDPPMVGTKPNCSCPAGTTGSDCHLDCTTTNVFQDSGKILAGMVAYDDFSVPDSGRLDVTLDWTFASSQIGFYVVPANTCTTIEEFNARSCNFLIRSEPSATKPRKISTPNFTAGNYRWLIANFSEQDESVSFQVVLSKGTGCPALAGGSPAASSEAEPALPPVRRMQHR